MKSFRLCPVVGLVVWCSFLCCGVGLGSVAMAANANTCNAQLAKTRYVQAAACYQQLVRSMKPTSRLSVVEAKEKALYLRKISFAYKKAAMAAKKPEVQAYLYEQSIEPLRRIRREKLCGKSFRCKIIQGQEAALVDKIKYASLSLVLSSSASVQVAIKGYRFSRSMTLQTTTVRKLRPGTYTVKYSQAGKAAQSAVVTLGPGEAKAITLTSLVVVKNRPASVSRSGPLSLIGISAGLFAIAAAGIVVGYLNQDAAVTQAAVQNNSRTDQALGIGNDNRKANEWAQAAGSIRSNHSLGSILVAVGWSLAGLGIAGTIGGTVWLNSLPSQSKPAAQLVVPQSPHKKAVSTSIVWQMNLP